MLPMIAALWAALLGLAGPIAGLTDAEIQRALAGQIPVRSETFTNDGGKDAGRALGAIVIGKPAAKVWAVLTRFGDKPDYMPRLEQVDVQEQREDFVRARFRVDATIMTARYTAVFKLDRAAGVIAWKLDRGAPDNTIRDTEGEYRLIPIDPDRTLLVYRAYVDSGRIVPRFIQNFLARRAIPDLLLSIRARAETNGEYRRRR